MCRNTTLLTPEKIAKKLNVSPKDIILKIESGEIAAIEFGKGKNKIYRITNDSFKEFLETNSKFIKKAAVEKSRTAKAFTGEQDSIPFEE